MKHVRVLTGEGNHTGFRPANRAKPRQLLIEVVLNDFHVSVVAERTVHRLDHRRRKIERDEFGIAPDSPH